MCMMLRDPFDTRDMPSNEAGFVNAFCIRGVRKVRSSIVVEDCMLTPWVVYTGRLAK